MTPQSQWNVRTKLTASAAALVVATLLLSGVSLMSISRLGEDLDVSVRRTARQAELAKSLQGNFQMMRASAHASQIGLVIALLEKGSPKEGQCTGCHESSMVQKHREAFSTAATKADREMDELKKLGGAEAPAELGKLKEDLAQWKGDYEKYLTLAQGPGFDQAHEIATGRIFPLLARSSEAAEKLAAQALKTMDETASASHARADRGMVVLIVMVIVALGVGAAALLVIRHNGQTIAGLVESLGSAARNVVSSGANISTNSQALAQGATSQQEELARTADESTEVVKAARSNCADAAKADSLMQQTAKRMEEARSSLHSMLEAMEGIHHSSDEIAKVLKIIDGIAFQTNILALNAAVEAARAGESGQGFAVVADEVRSLAHRCAEAAKETATMIEALRSRADDGRQRVEGAVASVDAVVTDAGEVRRLVSHVHAESETQAHSMERLGTALNRIESATQLAARNAEASASEAEELAQTSKELDESIDNLAVVMGVEG